ncbi:hypothetical protein TPHA_0E03720 [Tetrapisispora phaffii CBS 4417]|uniref:VHS domain-containing protein n=1 Tax=Tetrapisispora phaffii (strain ATCC 24235 / CBS 4417 / NBRC 1672 / NRRL Y-8282 / UCD 70-5) TaxID=1071381 RepID=G8BU83_TETPH|nr:hypothetical protein TPHA_0E03720 [Tetrapisispora phaffii CBS 4417]CCE63461.1 hypothetical protein TPHA_0E03720 [Tetrapisispora phaffii CBS 4417]
MGFLSDHQHTEISDYLEDLVSQDDNSTVFARKTVKLIRLIDDTRDDGLYLENQKEAARKIRKLLKYNDNVSVKKRCFNLLSEFIIYNNCKFRELYNDQKLLLAIQTTISANSKKIKFFTNCFLEWIKFINDGKNSSSSTYRGLVELYRQFKSKSSGNRRVFDLQKESPKIRLLVGDSLSTSIALKNRLLQLRPGQTSVDDKDSTDLFVKCRELRRAVLKYIQFVQEGELLGSLVHANDELVNSLKKYDELSGLDEVNNYDSATSESSYYETDEEDYDDIQPLSSRETSNASRAAPQNVNKQNSRDYDPFGDHNGIF